MVFSSIPVYLDPPNWQQQQQQPTHQQVGNTGSVSHHHHQQQQQQQQQHQQLISSLPPIPHVGSTIRPGSLADRARLAKLPQPETALKCPRCDSTNTKFCYFNNYSLTQPRHFCKTCRRYWTRGGALRNVPVGGGCRRNKKTKHSSSSSKSPASSAEKQQQNIGSNSSEINNNLSQQTSQLPFLPSLQNLTHYSIGNMGLNFGGVLQPQQINGSGGGSSNQHQLQTADLGFQIGNYSSSNTSGVHQFPLFEPTTASLYNYQSEEGVDGDSNNQQELRTMNLNSRVCDQPPVKREEPPQGLNLLSSRPFLGIADNNQFWSGNTTWTDLSGLNSSSANLI